MITKKAKAIRARRARKLARMLLSRFDIGHIAPGSVYDDFGWTVATLEEVSNFLELFQHFIKR